MSHENARNRMDSILSETDFRKQLVDTLSMKLKEDDVFRQKLFDALNLPSEKGKEIAGAQAKSKKVNIDCVLQLILTGILIALFVVIAALALTRIDDAPVGVKMGDRMEMYDPFLRAKELLILLTPLFTTAFSFWLGFSIQEKKVSQERKKREIADEKMAKIKGRTMMPPDNDSVSMLHQHIQAIMEVPKPNDNTQSPD